jgi:UDP-3-O-[3-hydroxymyristoyl] glucosamine N-acyltransferase
MTSLKPIKSLTISDILKDSNFGCTLPKGYNCDHNFNIIIKSANTIDIADCNDISFVSNTKYIKYTSTTKAIACVVSIEIAFEMLRLNPNCIPLVSKNPYLSFSKIVNAIYGGDEYYKADSLGFISPYARVSPYAQIDSSAKICDFAIIEDDVVIQKDVVVMQSSFIGRGSTLCERSYIYDNVSIYYSKIGQDTIIRSGARIGQLGFGFAPDGVGGSLKNQHICGVAIGDRVDIGANTTIDRGYLRDTKIGSDTKIDNMVVIGHGAVIGNGCFFAGNSSIAGSVNIGDYVVCGGHTGVAGHIDIASKSTIAANSGVTKSILTADTYAGFPAQQINKWRKQTAFINRLFKKTIDTSQ